MAGEEKSNIYCWSMHDGRLNIYLASSRKGAVMIRLSLQGPTDCRDYFNKIFPSERTLKDYKINRALIKSIEAVLKNRLVLSPIPLDIKYTPFQMKVWNTITSIPFGQTRTYGEVACMVGMHRAARAIGQAMRRNPLPLIFP